MLLAIMSLGYFVRQTNEIKGEFLIDWKCFSYYEILFRASNLGNKANLTDHLLYYLDQMRLYLHKDKNETCKLELYSVELIFSNAVFFSF